MFLFCWYHMVKPQLLRPVLNSLVLVLRINGQHLLSLLLSSAIQSTAQSSKDLRLKISDLYKPQVRQIFKLVYINEDKEFIFSGRMSVTDSFKVGHFSHLPKSLLQHNIYYQSFQFFFVVPRLFTPILQVAGGISRSLSNHLLLCQQTKEFLCIYDS